MYSIRCGSVRWCSYIAAPEISSRQHVLHLYRRLLRIQQAWPEDPLRPSRNIKETLSLKIREEFRRYRSEGNLHIVEKCLQDGHRQLQSLQLLLDNTYAKQYSRNIVLMDKIRPSPELCSLLSTAAQQKLMKKTDHRIRHWISRLVDLVKRKKS
jgi:hypothetical protein